MRADLRFFHLLLAYPKAEFTAQEFAQDTRLSQASTYRYFAAAETWGLLRRRRTFRPFGPPVSDIWHRALAFAYTP